MSSDNASSLRKQLLALGYYPLPNNCKIPAVKGWNSPEFIAREMKPERIEQWPERFEAPTTGVLITGGLCVIDIDVNHPLSGELFAAALTIAPQLDQAPVRFGASEHKMALFCRTENVFVRVASRRYDSHCVEIFGGAPLRNGNISRQFGIYGKYNEEAEYSWAIDVADLSKVALKDLPVLSKVEALAICGAFEQLAEAAGWTPEASPVTDQASVVYDIDDATRFDTDRAGRQLSYAELSAAQEALGDLRCSSSFMKGRDGRDPARCWVYHSKRHDCTAVYVYGDEAAHYPKQYATTDSGSVQIKPESGEKRELPPDINVHDFYAYMPKHAYLFAPNGDLWPAASINSRLPHTPIVDKAGNPVLDKKNKPLKMKPSTWLDKNRAVEQMSWAPGEPQVILDRLATEGGWIERGGVATFNLYQPPAIAAARGDAVRWLLLVKKLYPDHAEHIVRFCAHRIQKPAEKINHALVLTGSPGIGKDSLLEPLKYGVGPWNFREVSPQNIMDKHNDFVRSVCLRISEARDLGDINRYAMYEAMKTLIAAPPDMLRVDAKYIPQYYVPNITAIIATTNYPGDGMYLPADDRRHYVCGTEVTKDDFSEAYWRELWAWYAAGGLADIVGYLRAYDLTLFDAKRPPEKTEAFWRMVDAGRASEVPEISDAIDLAENPDAITVATVAAYSSHEMRTWIHDIRNRRTVPHRFESCGYVPVRNASNKDGQWVVNNKRQVVYCKRELSPGERYKAAEKLVYDAAHPKTEEKSNTIPFKVR